MLENQDSFALLADQAALLAIADDLKTPLIHIAYMAELGQATSNVESYERINITAKNAMAEIDALLLGLRATQGQLELALSPIAPSAVLLEAAQDLQKAAKQYHSEIILDTKKHAGTAMIHSVTLKHVICSLSQLLMKIGMGHSKDRRLFLRLTGSSAKPSLSILYKADVWEIIRDLQTRSKRTTNDRTAALLTDGPVAGYRVVAQLLSAMGADMQAVHNDDLCGFQLKLLPSTQLNLLS